jgi:hypothetical protein
MPRIGCLLIILAGRSVHLVAVGAFAMENRSSIAAPQQLFADTASTLLANIQHIECSFALFRCVLVE